MKRIGWIADATMVNFGAELSGGSLIKSCPDEYEIIPCQPRLIPPCDAYIFQNKYTFDKRVISFIKDKPVINVIRDMWLVADETLRSWLLQNSALTIFGSPLHRQKFVFPVETPIAYVPPPVNLKPFKDAARNAKNRSGVFWLGQMSGPWKGINAAVTWAKNNQTLVDFYGFGRDAPRDGKYVKNHGYVAYEDVPGIMAKYKSFLFLPAQMESFGRTVVEAVAAGCELIVNTNIGALWWLENDPAAILRAKQLFWDTVKPVIEGD